MKPSDDSIRPRRAQAVAVYRTDDIFDEGSDKIKLWLHVQYLHARIAGYSKVMLAKIAHVTTSLVDQLFKISVACIGDMQRIADYIVILSTSITNFFDKRVNSIQMVISAKSVRPTLICQPVNV